MGEKLIVGPIQKGLRSDVLPFNIDNDNFPILINAYQMRDRVKRKRGTAFLTRLNRYFDSSDTSYTSTGTIAVDGAGAANLLTGWSLETNASLVPGTINLDDNAGITYTDSGSDGVLVSTPGGDNGTVNYATGAISIPASAGTNLSATFWYYPGLPVLGIEDTILTTSPFPGTLGFDTTYAYNLTQASPYPNYSVSFYKNPAASASLPGYVAKTNPTPVSWNGQSYQQFDTANYASALWATNGITQPFTTTNIGMPFKSVTNVTFVAGGPGVSVDLTIASSGLVIGDWVFLNEFSSAVVTGINYQTGYVTNVVGATVTVYLPQATLGGAGGATTAGIAQYLTNRTDTTNDCLRWYDGDPTNGSTTTPVLNTEKGWVNFCPPLSEGTFSIGDAPAEIYYLVGARIIFPFKDRLIFFAPVVQTSSGSPIYLPDTIIFSQNGTPYYTVSYTNDPDATIDSPTSSSNVFTSLLVPSSQTATAPSWLEDSVGFGGFLSANINQQIVSISPNDDVLMVGFDEYYQTRLTYTGNDALPFNFFLINAEMGTASTFSTINMDAGVITQSYRGFILSNQHQVQRIDLPIPSEVFEIKLDNNGTQRMTAIRDYQNEWIYFTYPSNQSSAVFPSKTLQYNYRDNSWAVFFESYTTYGSFRFQSGFTWQTVGLIYPSWEVWTDPWNGGVSTLLQPQVVGGNQQGFVLVRGVGTGEGTSLYIQDITNSVVTSPDHGLNNGDYITISGALGTVSSEVNGNVFQITYIDTDSFTLDPPLTAGLTYTGSGLITRYYRPFIQTKQFPTAWGMGRKTRLGTQQYLLTRTDDGQITLLIYLSQDDSTPFNDYPIVPEPSGNNSLIYSTLLYTCPESTNLGLTPANVNLNTPTASTQGQIWHRMNTSLLGDTVQLAFTLSDDQMSDSDKSLQISEIELHGFILDVNPSQLLV